MVMWELAGGCKVNKNRALSLQLRTQGGDTEVVMLVNWWFDSTLGH
jgi:hypothetical protein